MSLVYFWQPNSELVEEDLLVVGRCGEAPISNVDAAAGWQDNIHHSQLAQFVENPTRLAGEARLLTHLAQKGAAQKGAIHRPEALALTESVF